MNRARTLLRTGLFIGGMLGLLAVVGYLVAGTAGLVLGALLGMALGGVGRASPAVVLRMHGARPLPPAAAPRLHGMVEELRRRARLDTTPALYYLPGATLNALAVGSRRGGAAIALSDGLLRHLDPRELAGVLAHELTHLRNGDLEVMTVADTLGRLTRAFAGLGQLLLLINLPMMLVGAAPISWWLILLLLGAPGLSALLQLGLSRSRELEADLGAARITGHPRALALALAKMERQRRSLLARILLPGAGVPESSLLRTHPHTEDRIERLLELEESAAAERAPSGGERGVRPPRVRPTGTWRRVA